MGLSVMEQIKARGESPEKKNVVKAPVEELTQAIDEKGTQGNYIEPIDGQQLKDTELANQYASDFGDEIDDSILAELSEPLDLQDKRIEITQKEGVSTKDVITPDGQHVTYKDPSKALAQQVGAVIPDQTVEGVDLNQYVAKDVHDRMVSGYNELQGKYKDLQGKVNSGVEGMTDQELKITNQIRYDIENSPLGAIVQDYYEGKLNPAVMGSSKKVSDFLLEGELYDQTEAIDQPGSVSWNARVKWEQEQSNSNQRYKEASDFVSKELEERSKLKGDNTDYDEADKKLRNDLFQRVPKAKDNEEVFFKWLEKQDNVYLPLYVGFLQLLKNNKIRQTAKSMVTPIPSVVSEISPHKSSDKDDAQLYDEFGD